MGKPRTGKGPNLGGVCRDYIKLRSALIPIEALREELQQRRANRPTHLSFLALCEDAERRGWLEFQIKLKEQGIEPIFETDEEKAHFEELKRSYPRDKA